MLVVATVRAVYKAAVLVVIGGEVCFDESSFACLLLGGGSIHD